MGQPQYSSRTIAEIRHDIDLLTQRHPMVKTAFFGDADPLAAGMKIFTAATCYLLEKSKVERLTSYARISTIYKLGRNNIRLLAEAGLKRVHLGLESGDPEILQFQRKGQTPKMIIATADLLKEAGIEISYYVLLGLGGQNLSDQHIRATAEIINATEPEFVRLRRLWLYDKNLETSCPLREQIRKGSFIEQTADGTVLEMQRLLTLLKPLNTFFACDHANNYINVSGLLKDDKEKMLQEVAGFLTRPREEREAHYRMVGSRI